MLVPMIADVMAEMPSGGRYEEAARGWLDGVLAEVFPDLLEGLRTRPSTRALSRDVDDRPAGEPGQIRGELWVGVTGPQSRRPALFNDATWQRMLGSLADSPLTASISIRVVGEDGYLSNESADIAVSRSEDEPEWVRFTF